MHLEICDPLRNIEYLGGAQTYTRLPELARGIAIAEVISRTFPRHLPGMFKKKGGRVPLMTRCRLRFLNQRAADGRCQPARS